MVEVVDLVQHSVVERALSIIYLTMGVSLLLQPKTWVKHIDDLISSQNMFALGFMITVLGGFIVSSHNHWDWSPHVITTVVGWIALVKGFLILTFPAGMIRLTQKMPITPTFARIEGVVVIALSSYIICNS